jgi:acetyl-CoA carboxylase biotin carboxyl carrier protein
MTEIRAQTVGLFEPLAKPGALVRPGDRIGRIVTLGVAHDVRAPDDAIGIVVGAVARGPVDFGAVLVTLDASQTVGGISEKREAGHTSGGLTFCAPTSGRFYGKSGPGKPPFVKVGDTIDEGQTVCLLEVMKTFNRVTYSGAKARVLEIAVADEADVDQGAVLLRLEPA